MSFSPFGLHEISVLIELILGHLRCLVTDVPPQPNSPPDCFFNLDHGRRDQATSARVPPQANRITAIDAATALSREVGPWRAAHLIPEASAFAEILPN